MQFNSDGSAEKGILSGICQYGQDSYLDVCDILKDTSFTIEYNKYIFSCFSEIYSHDEGRSIDAASIFSAARVLGLETIMSRPEVATHVDELFKFSVNKSNVRKLAMKVKKLEIARLLAERLNEGRKELRNVGGDESISEILAMAEDRVFDFSSSLEDGDDDPKQLGDGLLDYLEDLAENPIDQIGIPTGFPEYDKAIGGGLRSGTINVIGARSKVGKSQISGCMAYNIVKQGIPVLIMDTEMTFKDHLHRILAMASDCFIYDIETGKFGDKPGVNKKILDLAKKIESGDFPYYHRCIAGMPFEEQMAIMRRWIVKTVGVDSEGKANPCVIVYDYLKLMDSSGVNANMAEFQQLGFMMSSLHNFTVKYEIPMLALVQLNRDGIKNEGTDVAAGSDRIIWLCSNFSILKVKSDEEIAEDKVENGNRKLIPVVCRHGSGMEEGDYINCYMIGAKASIREGKTKFQIMKEQGKTEIKEDKPKKNYKNYKKEN